MIRSLALLPPSPLRQQMARLAASGPGTVQDGPRATLGRSMQRDNNIVVGDFGINQSAPDHGVGVLADMPRVVALDHFGASIVVIGDNADRDAGQQHPGYAAVPERVHGDFASVLP